VHDLAQELTYAMGRTFDLEKAAGAKPDVCPEHFCRGAFPRDNSQEYEGFSLGC
jgi:hypothetical protein